ncbi:MAG TPA: hypothetical protein VF911_17760 [Thermoanaerobaculia bacterium]
MNARIAAVVMLSATFALEAAPRTVAIEVPLGEEGLISASAIDDRGRGWIAVATPEPWRTDFYRIGPDGATRDARIAGSIVKSIRQLAGRERYFIHEARSHANGGASAFFRVVEAHGGKLTTLWDSDRLPANVRTDEFLVTVSDDARQWASASITDHEVRVTFGTTAATKPRTTVSVASEPVPLPDGFEYDGAGLEFIQRAGDKPLVAALWRGRIFIIDGERVVARLVPPNGASSLAFDSTSSTLWALSSRSAAAFDVRDVTKPAKVTILSGDHGRATEVSPLDGARLAMTMIDRGVLVSDVEDGNGNRVRKSFNRSGTHGRLVVSRGGNAILEQPDASRSRTVFLHLN